ncbi:hypothetical protein BJ742DRAFT_734628 [Cladochytrium replicatum]|nr:hypothetical protein BJ742DRAFT_734628 [Cladochytrium replicatum]
MAMAHKPAALVGAPEQGGNKPNGPSGLERNEMKLMEEAACAALVSSSRAKLATISTAGATTSTAAGSNPFCGGSSAALTVGTAANEFDPVAVASAARLPISACKWVLDGGEQDSMQRKIFVCAGLDRTLRIYTDREV